LPTTKKKKTKTLSQKHKRDFSFPLKP